MFAHHVQELLACPASSSIISATSLKFFCFMKRNAGMNTFPRLKVASIFVSQDDADTIKEGFFLFTTWRVLPYRSYPEGIDYGASSRCSSKESEFKFDADFIVMMIRLLLRRLDLLPFTWLRTQAPCNDEAIRKVVSSRTVSVGSQRWVGVQQTTEALIMRLIVDLLAHQSYFSTGKYTKKHGLRQKQNWSSYLPQFRKIVVTTFYYF